MPALPRKSAAKSPRKIVLQKSSASEILAGLRVTPSERQHAKKAVAAAKGAANVESGHTSELRVRYRTPRKASKAKK